MSVHGDFLASFAYCRPAHRSCHRHNATAITIGKPIKKTNAHHRGCTLLPIHPSSIPLIGIETDLPALPTLYRVSSKSESILPSFTKFFFCNNILRKLPVFCVYWVFIVFFASIGASISLPLPGFYRVFTEFSQGFYRVLSSFTGFLLGFT